MSRVSVNVLIWEYPFHSLKHLCPFCDPCDSLKTINIRAELSPSFGTELQRSLQENHFKFSPSSVRVVLINNLRAYKDLEKKNRRHKQAVLEQIQKFPVNDNVELLYFMADIHLTSLLLPKSINVTFSIDEEKYHGSWYRTIVDSCSLTKPINSHPELRPIIKRMGFRFRSLFQESRLVTYVKQLLFVSCHREAKHWTHQLKELISPFDKTTWFLILTICFILSCIVKTSGKSHSTLSKSSLFDVNFNIFCSILDQGSSVFTKPVRISLYSCIFCVPITWLYLSTLYKGDNVTRLTADPPLTPFDTFQTLQENQFDIFTRRVNLSSTFNSPFYNLGQIVTLLKQHGSIIAHEAVPVVSELCFVIMQQLRPSRRDGSKLSLLFLKDEVSQQMWKYINHSRMLPDFGQDDYENISTILNIHMNRCNKSAMIISRQKATKLHKILKSLGKPSYLGKDTIFETFWGYQFKGYFPPNSEQDISLMLAYLSGGKSSLISQLF